jgi:hypothetical protein
MSYLADNLAVHMAIRLLMSLVILVTASPAALAAAATPEDLDTWSAWVMDDIKDFGCPIAYNAETRRCSYPSHLALELNDNSGTFSQVWYVSRESIVFLPGNEEYWPLDVTIDDKPIAVVNHKGRPAITLDEGRYTVKGMFRWQRLPASLAVPPESGLVTLRLAGKNIARPDIRNNQLWLSDNKTNAETAWHIDIEVFRKITDAVPLRITTRMELEISGEQREISLTGALPGGFEPVSVDSRLPARLEASGRLLLKVRPGRWVIEVVGRMNHETLRLDLESFPAPWPSSELWVFEARPNLRMLKVEQPASIDASQSALPEEWKSLPAYRIKAGEAMVFDQIRRGDPQPEPDQLTLERKLWLDFTGDGYTVSDRISGTMARGWRINAGNDLLPGQVTLNDKPQLITRAANGAIGIEVRQGNINLAADSRIEAPVQQISATGWAHDFNRVSASINVPPGYRVLAIAGADRSPTTWLSRWTLLDFFIVLITTIALSRIHGKLWGVIGLVGFIALWHEPGAPAFIWLNLIATLSIMQALRNTRAYPFARNYLVLSSVALVLLALPFMIDQVRNGIYPQLEYAWQSMGAQTTRQRATPAQAQAPAEQKKLPSARITELAEDSYGVLSSLSSGYRIDQQEMLDKQVVDPNAKLQTGPGLPEWTWRSYPVTWNGPVQQGQELSVYIVNPAVNLFLNLFRVCIVLLLAWKLIRKPVEELLVHARQMATAALVLLIAGGTTFFPDESLASYPPQIMLKELQQRLLEPPDCLPQCADIAHMSIRLDPALASFTLQAHAAENLTMPLPVPLHDWTPSQVTIDGEPANALFRDSSGTLWVYVDKGVHEIAVQGNITHLRSMRLDFPLRPHRIEVSVSGWTSDGTDTLSPAIHSLTFTREHAETSGNLFDTKSDIPVFARVARHIRMGLDWQIITTVTLESGTALPTLLRVPLLKGESVVTDNIRVDGNHVIVSLNEANRTLSWLSSLQQSDILTLTAPQSQPWSETWSMEVTPVWNVSYDGIPVIYHQQSGGQWNPEWRPWPGEQVTMAITRPQGINGQTLTIEHSLLTLTPGKRATSAELAFTLRSSQGQQHTITLPPGAELETVSIDAKALPVRQDGNSVTLPLNPGSQDVIIKWKEARGIGWRFASPKVDLGIASVNARVVIVPGHDRWILLTGGIRQGPAVQFWDVLIVIVLIALALGRVKGTPLKTHSWILLGIGLSTVTPFIALLIAFWIFMLYGRGQVAGPDNHLRFNFMQSILVVLTVVAVFALFGAVSNGLLGNPDMQIAGNGSTHLQLNWYQDRIGNTIPQVWIVSVPVLAYRILMLAWSMWMAFALIKWLRWGWECFSYGRLWMSAKKAAAKHAGTHNDKPAVGNGT